MCIQRQISQLMAQFQNADSTGLGLRISKRNLKDFMASDSSLIRICDWSSKGRFKQQLSK